MGVIIFIITLCFVVSGVCTGIKRGLINSAIRILLEIIGDVTIGLLSVNISNRIVNRVLVAGGMAGYDITEAASDFFNRLGVGSDIANIFAVPATGIALSMAVPFVFVVLFIIVKVLSFIVYAIVRAILKNTKAGRVTEDRPVWSKVTGGILCGLAAWISCAIILMPFTGLTNTLSTKENKAAFNEIVEASLERTGDFKGKAFLNGKYLDIITDGILNTAYDYTGTGAMTDSIYRKLSRVKVSYVENSVRRGGFSKNNDYNFNSGIAYYSFPELITELLDIAPDVIRLINTSYDVENVDKDVVDNYERIFRKFLDSNMLMDNDKVTVANRIVDRLKEAMEDYRTVIDIDSMIRRYSDIDDLRNNYKDIFVFMRTALDFRDSGNKMNELWSMIRGQK